MTMNRSIFALLLGLYTFWCDAVGSPRRSIPETSIISLSLNTPDIPSSEIDPKFSYRGLYGGVDLPKTPLFVNVVELMTRYAEHDWLSRVTERSGIVLLAYPQVEMAVIPATRTTVVENRLIVWGLWAAINDMTIENKFTEVEFEILWSDEIVASIFFTIADSFLINGANNSQRQAAKSLDMALSLYGNETSLPVPIDDGSLDISSSLTYSNFDWMPYYLPGGKTLTPVESFLTIMAALKNSAPPAATDKVPAPFMSKVGNVDAHISFYFHQRRSPRTKPPFFQYIHVIKSMRLLPGYLLSHSRFSDLGFRIGVIGVLVADGFLKKGAYISGVDLIGQSGNVSTI